MYRIQTKGYDAKEKLVIARKCMLPKIREQMNFTEEDVAISDDVIQYIISNDTWTQQEQGVRNMKRSLEILHILHFLPQNALICLFARSLESRQDTDDGDWRGQQGEGAKLRGWDVCTS